MKSLPCYAGKGGAKEYAETLVKELAAQSQAIMLTLAQATDALAARERINNFRKATGRKFSLLAADHRLLEVDAMRLEATNTSGVQCYTPKDFRTLLEAAEVPLRAMIALSAPPVSDRLAIGPVRWGYPDSLVADHPAEVEVMRRDHFAGKHELIDCRVVFKPGQKAGFVVSKPGQIIFGL